MSQIASTLFFSLVLAGACALIVGILRTNAAAILAALGRQEPLTHVAPIPSNVRITQGRYAARLRTGAPRVPLQRAA